MEPRDRAAQEVTGTAAPAVARPRLVRRPACPCADRLASPSRRAAWSPTPSSTSPTDPAGFLARASHLWDPQAAFGQLQNQAYGYFWPMGPFFVLGLAGDCPAGRCSGRGWRWCCVSRSSGRLGWREHSGVRPTSPHAVAAFAYALPRGCSRLLGPISVEAWPSALAPWVLLPLVVGSETGSARRAAALSAVAVAMVGGVNAAATFAVIPLGALWLLTREPGSPRRRLMLWWPVFALLGTLWWLVPLFVLGSYSPPFLDFIESASNTTSRPRSSTPCAAPPTGCRTSIPTRSAGNDLIRLFHLPLLTAASCSCWGWSACSIAQPAPPVPRPRPARRAADGHGRPHRRRCRAGAPVRCSRCSTACWRRCATCTSSTRSSGCPWCWDSPGPGRGVARLRPRDVEAGGRDRRGAGPPTSVAGAGRHRRDRGARRVHARLHRPDHAHRGFLSVPGYWQQTAALARAAVGRRPGAARPWFLVRRVRVGEPARRADAVPRGSRWAVRNAVPLTPPGNIRMLDAVERRFAQGLGSAGLAPVPAGGPASATSSYATTWPSSGHTPTPCSCTRPCANLRA